MNLNLTDTVNLSRSSAIYEIPSYIQDMIR